jgi:hypothetical protein
VNASENYERGAVLTSKEAEILIAQGNEHTRSIGEHEDDIRALKEIISVMCDRLDFLQDSIFKAKKTPD